MNSHPLNITSAIQSQTASVVSKELLKSSAGSVTLFAFDQGEGLSDHQTSYNAMIMVIEGKILFTLGSKTHELSAMDYLILQPHTAHSLSAQTQAKMLLIMILPEKI
jgi:quercetin dioxygenase-like cupin family protein